MAALQAESAGWGTKKMSLNLVAAAAVAIFRGQGGLVTKQGRG